MTDISVKYYKAIIRSESFKPNNPPSLEEPPVVINPPGTTPGGPFEPSFLKGSIVQGAGVTISGTLTDRLVGIGDVTFNHLDTSSQATITNTTGNVIQSLGFDTFGHVTSGASLDGDFRWVRRHVLIDSSSTWLYTSETGSYPGVHVGHVTTGSSNFPSTLGQFAIFGGHQTNPTSYFARVFGFFRQYDSTNVYVGTANDTGTNNGWALIYTSYNLTLSTLGGEPAITAGTSSQYWRGDKTFQTLNTLAVPELTNLYFTEARVRSTPLTGYVVGANTALSDTDTVLGAFQKIQGQINARVSGTIASGQVAFGSGANTISGDSGLTWNNTSKVLSSLKGFSLARILDNSYTFVVSPINTLDFVLRNTGGSQSYIEMLAGGAVTVGSGASSEFIRINSAGLSILTGTSPTNTLDVNGTARIRSISSGTGDFLTKSATGVITSRTAAQVLSDISGLGGSIISGQVAFGTGTNTIGGNTNFLWDSINNRLSIGTSLLPSSTLYFGNAFNTNYIGLRADGTTPTGFYGMGAYSNASDFGIGFWVGTGASVPSSLAPSVFINAPGGSGASTRLGILTNAPTNTLDVNGSARIRTIANATGNFATYSATGVLQQRTPTELKSDIGLASLNNKVKTYYIDPTLLSGVGTIENQVKDYINANVTITSTLEFSKINIILGLDPTLAGFPYTMPLTLS